MTDHDYWKKHYSTDVLQGVDTLQVYKRHGTDWSQVQMRIHEMEPTVITIRSKEHAEALHFMLGQMLGIG